MDQKHHEELTAVASAIYDKAAEEIQAYIIKKTARIRIIPLCSRWRISTLSRMKRLPI